MIARGAGRAVHEVRPVRLGDVTPAGRLRLDALARYLQDVAADDDADAGLPENGGWILRRLALEIRRLPRLGQIVRSSTGCTGVGRGWAERTTTMAVAGATEVTTRAVWVWVDRVSGSPRALPPEFFTTYGEEVRQHRVSARLSLPAPPAGAAGVGWVWRVTDLDVYDHVNNAVYWSAVEEWLAGPGAGRRVAGALVEFGAGIGRGEPSELVTRTEPNATSLWFRVGADVRAAARVELAPIT